MAGVFWRAADLSSAAALLLNAVIGFIALYFLAKDGERLFLEDSPRKFYIIRFSLRLALFAVWIFLMLAVLRFHFLPVLIGLILPTFSFTAAVFFKTGGH